MNFYLKWGDDMANLFKKIRFGFWTKPPRGQVIIFFLLSSSFSAIFQLKSTNPQIIVRWQTFWETFNSSAICHNLEKYLHIRHFLQIITHFPPYCVCCWLFWKGIQVKQPLTKRWSFYHLPENEKVGWFFCNCLVFAHCGRRSSKEANAQFSGGMEGGSFLFCPVMATTRICQAPDMQQ